MKGITLFILLLLCSGLSAQVDLKMKLQDYVQQFNAADDEAVVNMIANKESAGWLEAMPAFHSQ